MRVLLFLLLLTLFSAGVALDHAGEFTWADPDAYDTRARELASMDFDGYGIGGSFSKWDILDILEKVNGELPKEKPRHLLGIGEPEDIFIGVAAVADYRPVETLPQKLKKSAGTMTLALTRNPDIIATVAGLEQRPFTVGFAAETENIEATNHIGHGTRRMNRNVTAHRIWR